MDPTVAPAPDAAAPASTPPGAAMEGNSAAPAAPASSAPDDAPVVEMANKAAEASSEAKPVSVALAAKSAATPVADGFKGTPAPEQADHSKIRITLDEACMKLSAERHGPEILGAFRHTERTAKEPKMLDLESSYRERFEAFADRPVS